MNGPIDPYSALRRPAWWAALGALVLNDHVLKHAAPGLLTGKLSDVAGMLVAPALLAALLHVRTRRGFALAHLAVGVVFALINLIPGAAASLEALMALTPFPWAITVDPTDVLVAAPALFASWALFTRTDIRKVSIQSLASRGALVMGTLACVATSPPPEEPPQGPPIFPQISGRVFVGNDSGELLTLRVRGLRPSVVIDCERVAEDPSGMLSRELFGPAETWEVDSGRVFAPTWTPAQSPSSAAPARCGAYLIDGGGVPMRLMFFEDLDPRSIESTTPGLPGRTVLLGPLDQANPWQAHALLYPAPEPLDVEPPAGCGVVDPTVGVDWSGPLPIGEHTIEGLETSPDGCTAFELSGVESRWFLCTVPGAMPFEVGDWVVIQSLYAGQAFEDIAGVEIIGTGSVLKVGRGQDVVPFGEGDFAIVDDEECTPGHDACGSYVEPLEVRLYDAADEAWKGVRSGGSVRVGGGRMYVPRAQDLTVYDSECQQPIGGGGIMIDSIFIEEVEQ